MRRLTILAAVLLVVAACGDDDSGLPLTTTTTAGVTTTSPAATTTTSGESATTTTTTKPGDDRVDGLALAGGFQGDAPPATVPDAPATGGYSGYEEIVDDYGILSVSVPIEWADRLGSPWTTNIFGVDGGDEGIGVALSASPDRAAWESTWGTPGLFFGASDMLPGTVDELLDAYQGSFAASDCTYDGRYEYDDGAYAGAYEWWYDCGDTGAVFVVIVARPPGGEFTAVVEITMVTEADLAAGDEIVASYYVTVPELTGDGGALDASLEANYGAAELVYGFEPDPQALAMEAGGDIDVSAYLGGDCKGFVTAQPDLELAYSGSVGGLLRFFFVADDANADTVMVINDPAGDWWCADDSFDTFNPTIEFVPSLDGVYDIWVGTYESGTLIPGTLYVTEIDANHP